MIVTFVPVAISNILQTKMSRRTDALCAFPRHSLLKEVRLFTCIQRCRAIKGCEAVNFKPTTQCRVGDCIIIAPPDAGIVVVEEDHWYFYAVNIV